MIVFAIHIDTDTWRRNNSLLYFSYPFHYGVLKFLFDQLHSNTHAGYTIKNISDTLKIYLLWSNSPLSAFVV